MASVDGALPTLLCSRPASSFGEPSKHPRPVPTALELAEDPRKDSSPGLRVKNTFIEGAASLSPSLGTFYQERAVRSCPSKNIGRCLSLLEEPADQMPTTPVGALLNIQTPCSSCSIQTPMGNLFEREALWGWCDPTHGYQSYAGLSQVGLCTDMYAGANPPVTADSSLEHIARQGNHEFRTVLSLASALEQEAAGAYDLQCGGIETEHRAEFQQACLGFLGEEAARCTSGGCSERLPSVLDSLPQYMAPAIEVGTDISRPPSGPALGSPELPSLGSAGHAHGVCKPCAFFYTKGCENDVACQFCHLCGPEVRKARKQEKLQQRREWNRAKKDKQAVHKSRSM
jgi:hypothetical protein